MFYYLQMIVKYNSYYENNKTYEYNKFDDIKHKKKVILLDCSYCKLLNIIEILKFENLEELYCDNNLLTSLDGINKLKKLEILNCSHNLLTKMDYILGLNELCKLNCSYNKLEHFFSNFKQMIKPPIVLTIFIP